MDLFRDYAIEINPDEKVFRVYDRVPESIEQMSDFVLRLRNSNLVELDLNKAGRIMALLDTGSEFGITLEQNIFDKLVDQDRIGRCVPSRAVSLAGYHERLSGQLSDEPLCDLLKDSVVVHQAVTPNPQQSSTNLGWPFLRRFVTVIDFTRNRVLLRKSRYFAEHEVIDMSGIGFTKTEQGIVVSGCHENGPAHKAGIEPGTLLMGIDETPTSEMSTFEIERRLSVQGKSVKLTVRQNSMEKDVTITLLDFQDTVIPQRDAEAKLLADIHVSTESVIPIVTIDVNDQMMSAILDTTVGSLVLDMTTAANLGIPHDSQLDIAGSIESIRVGGQAWKVDTVPVLDLSPRTKAFDQKIQAVIGPYLFGENVVHLDLGNNRVQIFDRVSKLVQTEFECCRLRPDQNGMKIAVEIPGYGAEDFYLASSVYLPLTLRGEVFDTLVQRKLMNKSGSEKANTSAEGISDFPLGKLRTLNIGTLAWENVEPIRYQLSCIGIELLRNMVVVIDRKNQCCYIKRVHQEDAVDLSGLTLMRGDSGVTVLRCKQDSIAEAAGIKTRDRLLKFNGSDVETLSLALLRQMLSEPASTVSLLVQRSESESFTVDLKL
ncbi:MAG: PDZ domain-containing protein [Planctomycetota bacterium]